MRPRLFRALAGVLFVASLACSDGRDPPPPSDGDVPGMDASGSDGGSGGLDATVPPDGGCSEDPAVIAERCPELRYCLVADLPCGAPDCVYSPRDCDDGDHCTADSCDDDARTCGHTFEVPFGAYESGDTLCTNGIDDDCDGLTDGEESTCGGCVDDSECDDANVCTDDSCVANLCAHVPVMVTTTCDDADACTDNDRCDAGACIGDLMDGDSDGHPGTACGGMDCDDADPTRHPGALEQPGPRCSDAIDNDCDVGIDLFDRGCNPMCLRGWCWVSPLVHGWRTWTSTVDGSLPWFGTTDGVALRWTGAGWEAYDTGTTSRIEGIWARSSTDAWAVGANGLVSHFDGAAWTVGGGPSTTMGLAAVTGHGASDLWVGGQGGTVFQRSGGSWIDRSMAPGTFVAGIAVASDGTPWAVTSSGVFRWNGTAWVSVVAGSFGFIGHGATDELWAAGSGVYRYRTGAWAASAGAPAEVDAFWVGTDGVVWTRDVFVSSADYYRFDGTTWAERSPFSDAARFAGVSGTEVWFANDTGGMWRHDGTTIRQFSDGSGARRLVDERELHAVFALRDDAAWTTGEYGTVIVWDGTSWRELPDNMHASNTSTIEHHNWGVWAAADDDVYIVGGAQRGGNGFLERWNGTTWATLATSTERLRAVWGSAPDDLWIAASGGALRWNGTALVAPAGGTMSGELIAVAGRTASDVWLGGGGTLLHWNGGTFSSEALPCGPVSIGDLAVTSDAALWVVFTVSGSSHDCPMSGSTVARRTASGWTYGPWTSAGGNLHATAPNDVWLATSNDLHHWNGSAWTTRPREGVGVDAMGGVAGGPLWSVGRPRAIRRRDGT